MCHPVGRRRDSQKCHQRRQSVGKAGQGQQYIKICVQSIRMINTLAGVLSLNEHLRGLKHLEELPCGHLDDGPIVLAVQVAATVEKVQVFPY